MTLFSYKVFVTIVEHMNFRKAAEELNLTPSAVSHCVSGMEEELGFPLFIRKTINQSYRRCQVTSSLYKTASFKRKCSKSGNCRDTRF